MNHRSAVIGTVTLTIGILLLLFGGLLYVLYRPQTLLLFHVADQLGLSAVIGQGRLWASAWQPAAFVIYCLPAGLWAMSYVLIVAGLAEALQPMARFSAVAFIPLIGGVSELMQAVDIIPGTFDWADLLLYLLPLVLYMAYSLNVKHKTQ